MITIENFENAGYRTETFGKNNQFHHNIQTPWVYRSDTELNLISVIDSITSKFTILESNSMGGIHHARIIDEKAGGMLDIEIHEKYINVYPTKQDHIASSKKLIDLLSNGCI